MRKPTTFHHSIAPITIKLKKVWLPLLPPHHPTILYAVCVHLCEHAFSPCKLIHPHLVPTHLTNCMSVCIVYTGSSFPQKLILNEIATILYSSVKLSIQGHICHCKVKVSIDQILLVGCTIQFRDGDEVIWTNDNRCILSKCHSLSKFWWVTVINNNLLYMVPRVAMLIEKGNGYLPAEGPWELIIKLPSLQLNVHRNMLCFCNGNTTIIIIASVCVYAFNFKVTLKSRPTHWPRLHGVV